MEWDENRMYNVVLNRHEETYAIWPVDYELPNGWETIGFSGTKQECLDHIAILWTDMRPLSLRKRMEEMLKEQERLKREGKT